MSIRIPFGPLVIGFLAIVAVIGCSGREPEAPNSSGDERGLKPETPAPPPVESNAKNPEESNAKPPKEENFTVVDQKIGPDEFVAAFVKDRRATKEQYNGKVIEVTGKVVAISSTRGGLLHEPAIGLGRTDGETEKGHELWCMPKNKEPWREVGVGDEVTIWGRVSITTLFGLWVDSCIVKSTNGGPMQIITADELTRRFAEDRDALKADLEGEPVVVEGEIASARLIDPLGWVGGVNLKGHDGAVLPVDFRMHLSSLEEPDDWIKPGTTLLVSGTIAFDADSLVSKEEFSLSEADPLRGLPKIGARGHE